MTVRASLAICAFLLFGLSSPTVAQSDSWHFTMVDPPPDHWQELWKVADEVGVLNVFEVNEVDTIRREHLDQLVRLPKLQTLMLGSMRVDDASLDAIVRCRKLKAIVLYNATVTVAGLKKLAALPHLEVLALYESKITPAELRTLKATFPNVHLELYDPNGQGRVFKSTGCLWGSFVKLYCRDPRKSSPTSME